MFNIGIFFIFLLLLILSFSFYLLGKISTLYTFLLCGGAVISYLLFRRIRFNFFRSYRSQFEGSQEIINLFQESIRSKQERLAHLPEKSGKAGVLLEVSRKFIEINQPEEVVDFLVRTVSQLFPDAENILFFEFNEHTLELARSVKKKKILIQEKTGDVVDKWVLKHNLSLLVENLTEDFRFDYNQVVAFRQRNIRSFVASPLSVGEKVLGIVRVESCVPQAFTLDDSRILRSVCDVAVVVWERARLFRKEEELAIKDPLTSLYVREHFFKRLDEELKRAELRDTGLGLVMFDIDDFKQINDSHGHVVGDIVLKRVAGILSDAVQGKGN
ncbi:MAG: diguanylate cyclase, partial [Candidatus Omnitrophica bacterium]|nr:diguanylate cyclase [Candidatus Omnitrophota bacterium]